MSVTIKWQPIKNNWHSINSSSRLKEILDDYIYDQFGENDISWLEGVYDCGHEGAKELIEAIKKHGSIDIKFEY